MDCSKSPVGSFTGKEHGYRIRDGAIELETRWTLNDLLALLAERAGLKNIVVRTNPHSNLPIFSGGEDGMRGILEILDSYEFNVQAEITRR